MGLGPSFRDSVRGGELKKESTNGETITDSSRLSSGRCMRKRHF